ncbi:hypothetical protein P43SY_003057 [Pythium insidiosum]|uniref:Uncharacterized protein n=1 Tax=Pythium insidiosum TaxID=114742 RepID=A0AAD5LL37_PYTIN|nr:hypothetical protein P43SY_003057 [Pythium insidiosum]
MAVWPLLTQLFLEPKSIFGDGHGDRYEQLSYFAFENDHYQVLAPRRVDCDGLRSALFPSTTASSATQDLVRAIPQAVFKSVRDYVVGQTTDSPVLSIQSSVLSLPASQSLCFGGTDDEGAVQIEALLSAQDAPSFGIDASCVQDGATHVRVRIVPTEFFVMDTIRELNPSRTAGAALVTTFVDAQLAARESSCFEATRLARHAATQNATEYQHAVKAYSSSLLVPESCAMFVHFDSRRNDFGCLYSAIGAAGAIAMLDSNGAQRSYAYPAPWRMIQCTVVGDCSSLLFTQLWLDEWTVERGTLLRHNFVNHKIVEVTVDETFTLRCIITVQLLMLVLTAYVTSPHRWYAIRRAKVAPWAKTPSATTSCTVTKVVRNVYNYVLVAQIVLGVLTWRRQLTIDMLVGAAPKDTVLRGFGCATLVITLATNVLNKLLKTTEVEPSVAHVASVVASMTLYALTHVGRIGQSTRSFLVHGMRSVSAQDVALHSGCRGSLVCADIVSLRDYALVILAFLMGAHVVGRVAQRVLQRSVTRGDGQRIASCSTSSSTSLAVATSEPSTRPSIISTNSINSFTRNLDARLRDIKAYDRSFQVYVQGPTGLSTLSTRAQLESRGFVTATTLIFRYRSLPLYLLARVLPTRALHLFNWTVEIHELQETDERVNGVRVLAVSDQVMYAHWSQLHVISLDGDEAYYGGASTRTSSMIVGVLRH